MIFYFILSTFVLFISLNKPDTVINNRYNNQFILVCFMILITFYASIAKYSFDSDMAIYLNEITNFKNQSFFEVISNSSREPLFAILQWFFSKTSSNVIIIKFLFSTLVITILIYSLQIIFDKRNLLFVFFTYINLFFFYNYLTVALRQGIAISLILLVLCYSLKSKSNIKVIIIAFISMLFHWSAIPIGLILIFKLYRINSKMIIFSWFISTVLYFSQVHVEILRKTLNIFPQVSKYLYANTSYYYQSNSQLNFFLFSSIWIIISLFLYYKVNKDKNYLNLIHIYILFNIIFLIMGFIPYSDRIAIYSWFIIPLLIWYPLIDQVNQKYRIFSFFIVLASICIGVITNVYLFYQL